MTGRLPFTYQRIHAKYGDVVRILPIELSLCSPAAWKDIYQWHPGHQLLTKNPQAQSPNGEGVYNIVTVSNAADHVRYRRQINPAFTTKAFNDQEPSISAHVDLLMKRLHQRCDEGPQDMLRWANLLFFDIIAYLTFGESLHGLQSENYHPWLEGFFGTTMKMVTFQRAMGRLPYLSRLFRVLMPRTLVKQQTKHEDFVRDNVNSRISDISDRKDFMSHVLPFDERKAEMSMAKMRATYGTLMLAGSENMATTFIFTVYLLLKNPSALTQLVLEIRNNFTTEDAVTFRAVNSLKILSALVDESMRIKSAAPSSQQRVVPARGETIAGHWVPEEVSLALRFPHLRVRARLADLPRCTQEFPHRPTVRTGLENISMSRMLSFQNVG